MLLTVGIGSLVVFETTPANVLVIAVGMVLAWAAFLYCLGSATVWK